MGRATMPLNFRVWAPHASTVNLVALGRDHPMKAGDNHWWTVDLDTGDDEPGDRTDGPPEIDYGFRLDSGDKVLPDPRSRRQPQGVHQPSRIFDPAGYRWNDAGWTGRRLAGSLIYELHVGTFTTEGTLDAAIGKLDHLTSIGVTMVELLPVNAFNGTHNWGYDGVLWFAVHEAYGGPRAYQRFVDACHQRGIGVIQDVVYNHLGVSGNYLPLFGPYLHDDGRNSTWGASVNLDGPLSDEVRRYILDNVTMWLRDYHVDGLRLDAVHALTDTHAIHLLEDIAIEVDDGYVLEQVDGVGVGERVHRVQPQPVDVVIPQPHRDVVQDVAAHLVGQRPVEIDRRTPGAVACVVVQIGPEQRQIVAADTEVVVDDVLDDPDATLMAGVDEALVGPRAAVGLVHGKPEHAVVAPVVGPVECVDRQQFHHRDADRRQVIELADRGVEGALCGERADMQLVDEAPGQSAAGPSGVVPPVAGGVEDARGLMHTLRLPPGSRVGQHLVAGVEPETVVDLRRAIGAITGFVITSIQIDRPPMVVAGLHGMVPAQRDQVHGGRVRRPHPEVQRHRRSPHRVVGMAG